MALSDLLRYRFDRFIGDVLYGNRVALLEERLRVFQCAAEVIRRSDHLLHTQLAVAIDVHQTQRVAADLQTINRAGQNGPHLLVQLTEMTDVLCRLNAYARHTAHARKTPFVFSHFSMKFQ